ncbi:MAG: DUF192 domain-containing protein [Cyanobacteria bacterium J06642_2]
MRLLVLVLIATGCAVKQAVEAQPETTSRPTIADLAPRQGQRLPIGAKAQIGDREFELEVARSAQQQQIGLMFREDLADGRGMVFPFEPARPVSFWMHNVRFALDMLFLYEDEIVDMALSVPGCPEVPCPSYGPPRNVNVDRVVELKGGTVDQLGVQTGDRVVVEFIEVESDVTVRDESRAANP